jgi:glucosamine kinase
MSGECFIGIDGGASSCRARIRDAQGNLLGEGVSGPANVHLDLRLAKHSIRSAIDLARKAAGLNDRLLHRAHLGLGLAGSGSRDADTSIRAELSRFASVELDSDAYIAWLGAHHGQDGAIVVLGTGSCGFAMIDGQRINVAGWGAEVSDEAGGQRIGREVLRRTLWAYDGRAAKTELSEAILSRFRSDPSRIVAFASRATPAAYAELAPIVFHYAALQDPLAGSLVAEAASAAVRMINRLIDVGVQRISLIGGLAEPLTPWLPIRIRQILKPSRSDPLDGAIMMAQYSSKRTAWVTLRAG